MNISFLFLTITTGLVLIYVLFKPLDIKQQEFVDVPLFELISFSVYDLSNKGLNNIMLGKKATKYSDRYTVENIDYTDNSKNFVANMKSNYGVYKDDIVDLEGNVTYTREDGLIFKTQFITYNKQTGIASTDRSYISYKGQDKVMGTSLLYNNVLNQVSSKNVVAIYNFKEKTK